MPLTGCILLQLVYCVVAMVMYAWRCCNKKHSLHEFCVMWLGSLGPLYTLKCQPSGLMLWIPSIAVLRRQCQKSAYLWNSQAIKVAIFFWRSLNSRQLISSTWHKTCSGCRLTLLPASRLCKWTNCSEIDGWYSPLRCCTSCWSFLHNVSRNFLVNSIP